MIKQQQQNTLLLKILEKIMYKEIKTIKERESSCIMSCVHVLWQVQAVSRGMIQISSLCHALTELNESQTVL